MKLLLPLNKSFLFILLILFTINIKAQSLCAEGENFQYVIISSNALKNAETDYSLSTLKDYRISKGLPSIIITTEDIYSHYNGRDNAEKIRNFIKDATRIWGAKYILLGGDTNIIPARFLRARGIDVPSDMYYGCLDGDFNKNDNNIWGEVGDEPDFEFDVFVGRASAENTSEMANFVYKTITYGNSPLNASYHTKMIQYAQEKSGIGNTEKWQNAYRNLNNELSIEYFRLTDANADRILKPRFSFLNFGLYVGASHGLIPTIGNINRAEAQALENNDQFFFMLTIACLAGQFTSNCVAEHLCTSTRTGGAFAGMFNSENAYPPYVVKYIYEIRDKHLAKGITHLGELRAEAAKAYPLNTYLDNTSEGDKRRYQAYEYNLFGDPATEWKLYKSKAIDLSFDFESSTNGVYTDSSNNNFKATMLNGASTIVDGANSNVVLLDGVDDYIEIPHSDWNPMGFQSELSLSVWICAKKINKNAGIIVKGDHSNPFALTLDSKGQVHFEMNKNTPEKAIGSISITSNTVIKTKQWYHITISLNYQNSLLSLYVNGEKDKSITLNDKWLIGYTNAPLYVGINKSENACFSGFIDDINIYGRDLTINEILALKGPERVCNSTTKAENIRNASFNEKNSLFSIITNKDNLKVNYQGDSDDLFAIKLFNLSGQVLSNKQHSFRYEDEYVIDTRLLEKGTYILSISNKQFIELKKFINF